MASIPADVMLTIVNYLDIDTFLDFRITSREHYALVNTHMNGLTEELVRTPFPAQAPRLLKH